VATLKPAMSAPEAGRATRLGGLILAGSALLAAAALGREWSFAPGLLRNLVVELVLVGAGAVLLLIALVALALDRAKPSRAPDQTPPAGATPSGSSLMALPAIMGKEPSVSDAPPTDSSPSPPPGVPLGMTAGAPAGSTLLIPFADTLTPSPPASVDPASGSTVTGLVDRMDALQRAAPAATVPTASSSPAPEPATMASALLLRLTRIPAPPATPSAAVARRCTDCGDPLGSPPLFEPCADCGRALCERCYWRESSGPQAHLCTTCVQHRAVPRPPTPAVTFGRPTPVASVSKPSGRPLQPRRPVS
jgi:hypothetical protein